jgi:hypothetical protein
MAFAPALLLIEICFVDTLSHVWEEMLVRIFTEMLFILHWKPLNVFQRVLRGLGAVAYTCSLSYSGGWSFQASLGK